MTLIRHELPVPLPDKVDTARGRITIFDPKMDVYWDVGDVD